MEKSKLTRVEILRKFLEKPPISFELRARRKDHNFVAFPEHFKKIQDLLDQYRHFSLMRKLYSKQDLDELLKTAYPEEEKSLILTYVAENGKKAQAGSAYYTLSCRYSADGDKDQQYMKAYFAGQALKKGYVTEKTKEAYAMAAMKLGWFDTAFNWFPEEKPYHELARAYLTHLVRMSKERGIKLPETDEAGIVKFQATSTAATLREVLFSDEVFRQSEAFCYAAETFESHLPEKIEELESRLEAKEPFLVEKKKKAERWGKRILMTLLLITLPGAVRGNLRGAINQALYAIYVILCGGDIIGGSKLSGLPLAKRMSAYLTRGDRMTYYFVFVVFCIAAMLFLRFLGKQKRIIQYQRFKKKLLAECDFQHLMTSPAFECQTPHSVQQLQEKGFNSLAGLINSYHAACAGSIEPMPEIILPRKNQSIYLSDYPEFMLNDYENFSMVMRIIFENHFDGCLWSGEDLVHLYVSLTDQEAENFGKYFKAMFDSAALLAKKRGDQSSADYLNEQSKVLEMEIQRRQRKKMMELSGGSSGSVSMVSATDPEKSEKEFNLWINGSYATNQEMLWDLHQRGSISDDQYLKNIFNDGKIRVTSDDDDGC